MFHRFRIGEMNATVVSDGPLTLGPPHKVFRGPPAKAIADALTATGQATDALHVAQNCLVVDTPAGRALFDTGLGDEKPYGPDSGKLLASLAEAGIAPESIDAVVLTHAHSDHCWGTPAFRNARIIMAEAELAYWTADPPLETHRPSLEGFRRHILPLRDRIETVRDKQAFLPGVQAWATPGHTPGHLAFLFEGGWCLTGDAAWHDPLSYAFPEAQAAYDTDRAQGVQTRLRVLDRLAADRLRVIGYHHPWPGLGWVERGAGGFRFVAEA